MPTKAWRDTDDGYRGYLRNPATGCEFKANATTARRADLERISHPGAEAATETSRDQEVEAVARDAEPATNDETVAKNNEDANAALDALLEDARNTEDKAKLKAIGGQVGLKLSNNMNVETMKDRIETQVSTILAATEG